jgi:hypothetical protein
LLGGSGGDGQQRECEEGYELLREGLKAHG